MAFWNRKKPAETDQLPEEVREYYASTKRTRGLSAWLFGLLALILTLLIAVALYFAGKFVWEQFFSDEPESTTTTEQTAVNDQPEQPDQDTGSNNANNNEDNQTSPSEPQTLPGDNNDNPETETDTNGVNGANTALESTPETGPGDTVAIFIGTVLIATLGYEAFARKKQA